MRGKLSRLSLMTGVILLTAAGLMLLAHGVRAQHTPPNWPNDETHEDTPCFGGNICYVCPQQSGIACTAAQPAAGWTQGACQLGYPAGIFIICFDTTFSCGNQITCADGRPTGVACYTGPWCRN